MNGDWVKMRPDLIANAKVLAMCRTLERDEDFMSWMIYEPCDSSGDRLPTVTQTVTDASLRYVCVTGLLQVWGNARRNADNGMLRCATIKDLDTISGIPGMGKAMESVGWATQTTNGVVFPSFDDEHSSTSSAAVRMRRFRERNKSVTSDANKNVTVTTEKRREEKNREENTTPITPKGGCVSDEIEAIYQAYPRHTAKADAIKAIKKALTTIAGDKLLAKVQEYAAANNGRPDTNYLPHPATWFNGHRWEDDPTEWTKWQNAQGAESSRFGDSDADAEARLAANMGGV